MDQGDSHEREMARLNRLLGTDLWLFIQLVVIDYVFFRIFRLGWTSGPMADRDLTVGAGSC